MDFIASMSYKESTNPQVALVQYKHSPSAVGRWPRVILIFPG